MRSWDDQLEDGSLLLGSRRQLTDPVGQVDGHFEKSVESKTRLWCFGKGLCFFVLFSIAWFHASGSNEVRYAFLLFGGSV